MGRPLLIVALVALLMATGVAGAATDRETRLPMGSTAPVDVSPLEQVVVVRGDRRTVVADPDRVVELAKELSRRSFGPATAKYRELGTVSNLLTFNRLNALPTRNFQAGSFAGAEAISGEALNDARRVRPVSSASAC